MSNHLMSKEKKEKQERQERLRQIIMNAFNETIKEYEEKHKDKKLINS